jgi:hypothetical protein
VRLIEWIAAAVVACVAAVAAASPPSPSSLSLAHPTETSVCVPAVHVEGADVPQVVTTELADRAKEWMLELRARVGDTDCRPITVTVIPSMSQATALEPPWHLPVWAAGAASPQERRIVVGITSGGHVQDRERTVRHELVHVLVRSAAGGVSLPRWLDEGLARLLADEHGLDDLQVLAQARLGDRFITLTALASSFPPGSADAALAYAQAGRAASLLFGRDDDDIARFLGLIREGVDVDDALRTVCGRATWQIDIDVRRSVGLWAALATVGLESDLAMAGCGVIVAVYGVRARRRQRARLIAMDDGRAPSWALSTAVVARWTVRRSPW